MKKILGILFLLSTALACAENQGQPDYEKEAQEAWEKADLKTIARLIATERITAQPWIDKMDAIRPDACQVVKAEWWKGKPLSESFTVKNPEMCGGIMHFGMILWWVEHDIMVAKRPYKQDDDSGYSGHGSGLRHYYDLQGY